MLWPWLMAFLLPFPLLALRSEQTYRRLSRLPGASPLPERLPALSIIVPARNEAENLARLLPSLRGQEYPGAVEIIVVDDGSTDRTAEVAAEHGVRVERAGALPEHWLGKPYACHLGARASEGAWLLFTDADTCHHPDAAAAAAGYAVERQLDGLSLLLRGRPFGLPDRLTFMAAFSGLFAGFVRGHPLLNGQYILVRRETYFETGGFEAVRAEPLEDLALAHRLEACGADVPLLLGDEFADVYMYNELDRLWKGLVRLGSGSLKWSGAGGWLTALFITGALLPALGFLFVPLLEMPPIWIPISWTIVAAAFIPWARRAGGVQYACLAPVGALIVQLAAVTGIVRALTGAGRSWKGRLV